jgi:hypothetical protein
LELDVDAAGVGAGAFLHGLLALGFCLFLVNEVGEADFGDAGVGLGDVSFYLWLGGGVFEGVFEALLGLLYAFLEGFY